MTQKRKAELANRLFDAVCIVVGAWGLFGGWAALLAFGLYGAACRLMPPVEERR